MFKKNKKFFYLLIVFFILAFICSIFYFFGIRLDKNASFFAFNFYSFIPLLAVFIIKVSYGEKFWQKDFYNFKFNANFLLVIYFLLGLELLIFTFDILLPITYFSNDQGVLLEKYGSIFSSQQFAVMTKFTKDFDINFFWILNVFIGIIVGVTTGTIFAYFQEIGWRGFLYNELKDKSFWAASIEIGLWHSLFYLFLVLIGYGDFYLVIVWLLLSPILMLIRKLSDSIIYPAIFVGVFNSTYALATFYVVGAPQWLIAVNGLGGIFILLLTNICLYLYMLYRERHAMSLI
ncbi:MAG: hypothetical protein GY817_05925 [bacterium]|nr:hypothetical protein [bacterium]